MSWSLLAPAMALVLVAAPAAAGAAPAPGTAPAPVILLVHADEGRGAAADRDLLATSLAREPDLAGHRLVVLEPEALAHSARAWDQARSVEEARRAAREGWIVVGHLEHARAAKLLETSLHAYAAAQPDVAACREAVGVLRDYAYAQWLQGRTHHAERLIAATAALPPVPLDLTRYPPPFVAFVKRAASPSPVEVTLLSRPAATVVADCADRGPTPRTLSVRGAALLLVEAAGREPWARWVAPGTSAVLQEITLRAGATARALSADVLAAVLRAQGAERLLLWRRQGGAIEILSFRAGDPRPAPWRTIAGEALPRRLGPDAVRPRRVAPWVVLGVGATSVVAGTVLAVMARQAASRINDAAAAGRLFDDSLARDDDRRRTYGTTAYVLWGVGAAVVAAGLALYLRPATPREP
jgi:hypothetical protein